MPMLPNHRQPSVGQTAVPRPLHSQLLAAPVAFHGQLAALLALHGQLTAMLPQTPRNLKLKNSRICYVIQLLTTSLSGNEPINSPQSEGPMSNDD